MIKREVLLVCLSLIWISLGGQDSYELKDKIYVDHIKTVKMHVEGLYTSYPIIDLNRPGKLSLNFDDFSEDVVDYSYKIIHCNADWQPSQLGELEYIDGFTEERISQYEFSFNTATIFTNYNLLLPNQDMRITKSGNYVLVVFEEDTGQTVITRRFCVVEPLMNIFPKFKRTVGLGRANTHQEIEFTVGHKGINVKSPKQEIKATILQNGRWDNAIIALEPLFVKPNLLTFDYQNKIVFPAGKEFRFADVRTFRYNTESVFEVSYTDDDEYLVLLKKDVKRGFQNYLQRRDINGQFVIENLDYNNGRIRQFVIQELDQVRRQLSRETDPEIRTELRGRIRDLLAELARENEKASEQDILQAEYGHVVFSLESFTVKDNTDIYIFGGLTDWELKEEYRMVYNEEYSSYIADVYLKQGYYNYTYALVDKVNGTVEFDDTEGNWYETENEYTILVYYRPFGERYDRLVAGVTVSSFR